MNEFLKQIIPIVSSTGISVVAVLIFVSRNWFLIRLKNSIKHEYTKNIEDHKNNLRKETDAELSRLNGKVSIEVEKAKLKMSFYSEKQFNLYNELWENLCELKVAMNELWAVINQENLIKFQEQLLKTDDLLEKRAILIEPHHYQKLRNILSEFGNYQLGKKSLYDLREEQGEIRNFNTLEIQTLIERNSLHRNALLNYLPKMLYCLRKQICGQSEENAMNESEDL